MKKINNTQISAIFFGIIFYFFCMASICGTFDEPVNNYERTSKALLLSITFWLFLLAIIRRVWIFLIFVFPATQLVPLEIWFRTKFGFPSSAQSIAMVLETSASESANFLMTYGDVLTIYWLTWILSYITTIWLAYKSQLVWSHRSYILCLIFFPAMLLIFYVESDMPPWIKKIKSSDAFDSQVSQGWNQKWEDVFPVNIIIGLQRYDLEKKNIQNIQSTLQYQSMNGNLSNADEAPDIVILVIGESSTATRWSLLGYPRKTTPHLDSKNNLLAFSDVVSLSVATRTAIPGVLSRRPVLRPEGFVDINAEPSLVRAFGEAGYKTHWFSNQAPFGKFDTSIAVYAREAQDVRFLNPSTFKSKGSFDEILLDPLYAVLNSPGKHFVVLHTLGSHFQYSMRYPDNFDIFVPSFKKIPLNVMTKKEKKESNENTYDNSIFYTSYFLSKLIDSVKNKHNRALLVYFSDHGIDLPNKICPYLEGTRLGEGAFRVPVLFWFSESMREKRSSEWIKLSENKTLPYTTRAIFSTLFDLSGISVSGNLPEENFLYKPNIEKNVRNVAVESNLINFDTARIKNSCFISKN